MLRAVPVVGHAARLVVTESVACWLRQTVVTGLASTGTAGVEFTFTVTRNLPPALMQPPVLFKQLHVIDRGGSNT